MTATTGVIDQRKATTRHTLEGLEDKEEIGEAVAAVNLGQFGHRV